MTDRTDQNPLEREAPDNVQAALSRRTLLGVIVALWSAGSLSDAQAVRLYYGTQGYGRFGYGGAVQVGRDEDGGGEEEIR